MTHAPVWAEVNLEILKKNIVSMKSHLDKKVRFIAVVKANAYGHGMVEVGKAALEAGAYLLAVARSGEALELKEKIPNAPILILGPTEDGDTEAVIKNGIEASVFSFDGSVKFSERAKRLQKDAAVHVKVDTGMHRFGIPVENAFDEIKKVSALPNVKIKGLFTHFAQSDKHESELTRQQLRTFQDLILKLRNDRLVIPLVHAANSCAVAWMPDSHFDAVRVGIAMYGIHIDANKKFPFALEPALSFKTRIIQIKDVPIGGCVSYGCLWKAPRDSRIAVIGAGYADGFKRNRKVFPWVLVSGRRVPVVGRIAMDVCMIDVTDTPGVSMGDEVVLVGRQGHEQVTAQEIASSLGIVPYEVVTCIGPRPMRVYVGG